MSSLTTLSDVLDLIGALNDKPGEDTARERFRRHLRKRITSTGQVRDFVEECLRNSGPQYNRALQDLVNHIGTLLEFEVTFGRYSGVQREIGFDGLWRSPSGTTIVVETKTTDAYSISTATLLNYMNELVSEKRVDPEEEVLGLYVVGRRDNSCRELENSIIAERNTDTLRIISTDHLLSLAELIADNQMGHDSALTILRPSRPSIDPLIDLMTDVISTTGTHAPTPEMVEQVEEERIAYPQVDEETGDDAAEYYLTSAQQGHSESAEEMVCRLLRENIWAFRENTPLRDRVNPGDWICFYAAGNGVIGHGRVRIPPGEDPETGEKARNMDLSSYPLALDSVQLYPDEPTVIDVDMRKRLDAFEGRDPSTAWGWFVHTLRRISRHDFSLLTGEKNL